MAEDTPSGFLDYALSRFAPSFSARNDRVASESSILTPFFQHQHQDAPVGMKTAAGSGSGFGQRRGWSHVGASRDQPAAGERGIDIFALTVDRGIDLVRDAVIALVALKADVVGGGNAPQWTSIHLVRRRRFPGPQVIAPGPALRH